MRAHQRGFSLLEVLVTITLTSVALLGAAGLQLRAMQSGQSSQARIQAVLLVADLAERIEANKRVEKDHPGIYVFTSTGAAGSASDCATTACSDAELAQYDLGKWSAQVAAQLPQATAWTVAAAVDASATAYTIVIHWSDRRVPASYDPALPGGSEAMRYQATRVVYRPAP
jgi:type IV pilus assembly protein PilV